MLLIIVVVPPTNGIRSGIVFCIIRLSLIVLVSIGELEVEEELTVAAVVLLAMLGEI